MKKLTIILILLIPLLSKGQVFTSIAVGYDFKGAPIGNWAIGYNKNLVNFAAEMRPSLTRKVETNNYFGMRLGFNLINPDEDGLSIIPSVGYYYNKRSNDKRQLNNWAAGYSLKGMIEVTETGNLFLEGFYSNSFQITCGIHVIFRD